MAFLANDSGTRPSEELYKAPSSAIKKNDELQVIEELICKVVSTKIPDKLFLRMESDYSE